MRGRSVNLRGMQRSPTGLLRWLAILGPGLIATAGNDAGGIATYSQAGAKFGYQLIWVMVILTGFLRCGAGNVRPPRSCDWQGLA